MPEKPKEEKLNIIVKRKKKEKSYAQVSKSLEEVKFTQKQIIHKKKLSPLKTRSKAKNVNISISNPEISIKTSYPQINSSKIHGAKLGTKKIIPSKSSSHPVKQPSSPKGADIIDYEKELKEIKKVEEKAKIGE